MIKAVRKGLNVYLSKSYLQLQIRFTFCFIKVNATKLNTTCCSQYCAQLTVNVFLMYRVYLKLFKYM